MDSSPSIGDYRIGHPSPSPRPKSSLTPSHLSRILHPTNHPSPSSSSSPPEQDIPVNTDGSALSPDARIIQTPRTSSRVSVHALTGVPTPSTPAPIGTPTTVTGLVLSGIRSRKSSCDLCHHRKIKVSSRCTELSSNSSRTPPMYRAMSQI